MSYQIYCLSHKNNVRANNMRLRFANLGLHGAVICPGIEYVHPDPNLPDNPTRPWSCMLGHLSMIRQFYETTNSEFGIFCEDDIRIHRDFKERLPTIIQDFRELNLDILLLGFLFAYPQEDLEVRLYNGCDILKKCDLPNTHSYYGYHDQMWGTQMYMLSRTHAKYLLDKYTLETAKRALVEHVPGWTHFSADWTLTKDGRRGLVWPMYAVENVDKTYEDEWQEYVHSSVSKGNLTEDYI